MEIAVYWEDEWSQAIERTTNHYFLALNIVCVLLLQNEILENGDRSPCRHTHTHAHTVDVTNAEAKKKYSTNSKHFELQMLVCILLSWARRKGAIATDRPKDKKNGVEFAFWFHFTNSGCFLRHFLDECSISRARVSPYNVITANVLSHHHQHQTSEINIMEHVVFISLYVSVTGFTAGSNTSQNPKYERQKEMHVIKVDSSIYPCGRCRLWALAMVKLPILYIGQDVCIVCITTASHQPKKALKHTDRWRK